MKIITDFFWKNYYLSLFFHRNYEKILSIQAELDQNPEKRDELIPEYNRIMRDICVDGVFKTTSQHRLVKTDEIIVDFLRSMKKRECAILDVGASDGTTTLDLHERIKAALPGHNVAITMIDRNVHMARFEGRVVNEYRDSSGKPLMVQLGRLGFRYPRSEYRFDILHNLLMKVYSEFREKLEFRKSEEYMLINPLVSRTETIQVIEQDLFKVDQLGKKFDVIRACNVLNDVYFSKEQIQTAERLFCSIMNDGGLYVKTRNAMHKKLLEGTILEEELTQVFRKANGELQKVE